MTSPQELKASIDASLKKCAKGPLAQGATELFRVLGYRSEKRLKLTPNSPQTFLRTFDRNNTLNSAGSFLNEWQSVDFLFQLTDEEVQTSALGRQSMLFESKNQYEGAVIESYLFLAIELQPRRYTRTELAS